MTLLLIIIFYLLIYWTGSTQPQSCNCLAICENRVIANIGHRGRYCDSNFAERPDVVITTIAEAATFNEVNTAAIATAWAGSTGGKVYK